MTTDARRVADAALRDVRAAGFSLIEVIVAIALTTLVMSVALTGLSDVIKGNELVATVGQINGALRSGTDLMVRDFLQAGSGLPSSHAIAIPSGGGAVPVRLPGPPGTAWTVPAGTLVLPAVMPRAGQGPVVNGVATDVVTVMMADNAFLDVTMTAMTNTTVTIAAGPDLAAGPDRVIEGQLMMISKLSVNTLVQVTDVDAANRVLTFAANDSLLLNQPGATEGSLRALILEEPLGADGVAASRISRIRMISYYLDATNPLRPRLVRRINNGLPDNFDNTLGTVVADDIHDLQLSYDVVNGVNNPGGVEMNAADLGGGGACAPNPCSETQIRKVNLRVMARASNQVSGNYPFLNNALESQVSLRAMAFVDRFQ
jgi:type II secretory pathway pseudopilin PulG